MYLTLLAAFQALLYSYTAQDNIIVGDPIDPRIRNWAEFKGMIGFLVNMLPLRTSFADNPTFRHLLARVQQMVLDAYAYSDLPFEALINEVWPDWYLRHNPFYQVMFAFQNTVPTSPVLQGMILDAVEINTETSLFDLYLAIVETDQGLKGHLDYNTDLFDEVTINQMLERFRTLLENIIADPGQSISTLCARFAHFQSGS